MLRNHRARLAGYALALAAAYAAGTLAGWTSFASRIDNYAYDLLSGYFGRYESAPEAAILAIDEKALGAGGGVGGIRAIVTQALERLAAAQPNVTAVDVILADASRDAAEDARLEAALRATPNLALPCDLLAAGWEDPQPRFRALAKAVGHIHAQESRLDGVTRELPLEYSAGGVRRWALALEAFRLYRGGPILESPEDLEVGGRTIPAARAGNRAMPIRYRPEGIPVVALGELEGNPAAAAEKLRGKAVFVGITAQTAARDRIVNTYGDALPGVEAHAHAFETMREGRFLVPLSETAKLALGAALCAAAGLIFVFLTGAYAYLAAALLLALAHTIPVLFFRSGVVSPYFAPVSAAWLSVVAAAAYQYFGVRKQLERAETDKTRYQQAIHFVAHEMRSPLTAIQGSSELMSRYKNLDEAKRQQLAGMIHSESKRLARMIQTFLDVERLSEGQMEMKKEPFSAAELISTCLARVEPLAGRKNIQLHYEQPVEASLVGDRELMEYALYNLLTNAVKYSPAGTNAWVEGARRDGELRLSVRDEGIGMDSKELKQIFTKFYRTKRAEASGEKGTGIGLSIVEQIVTHHGGRMEVVSEPGKGSCFTMVLRTNPS